MKLAILAEFFPPRLGSDRRIFEIMSRLSGKHEIHFVIVPPFRALSRDFAMGDNQLESHLKGTETHLELNGIRGHFIQIPHWLALLWERSYGMAYILTLIVLFPKIAGNLKKINPNVVVLNYPSVYTGLLGFFGGKVIRKPVSLDFNDLIAQYSILLLNLSRSSLTARLFVHVQDFLVRKCHKVVATTKLIRDYAINCGVNGDRLLVIPNGVDTKLFSPGAKNEENMKSKLDLNGKTVCFYGGRLDNWAGIDILIGLCKDFSNEEPDTRFLVVGGKLTEQEQPKNLTVMGETPFEVMPQILAAADVILVPFPENIVSHATSPLKLFEGMAMQKPVIASRVEGIEEIITSGKNGILVDDPNSIKRWREAIESVLKSKSLARRLGKEARQTVTMEFDWNHLAERYEKAFIS